MKRYRVTYIDYVYADSSDEAKETIASGINPGLIQKFSRVKEVPEEKVGGKG